MYKLDEATYRRAHEELMTLNEDELFYKAYYEAGKNPSELKSFLLNVDTEDAIRRHLVIPEILSDIISYEMNDDEYFRDNDGKDVVILPHNRYTPAFMHRHDFFEVIYVYEGFCTQNIGMNRRNFIKGDLILISPGIYHYMEVFDNNTIIFNILLRKKTFHRMFLPMAIGNDIQSEFFKEGLYNSHRLEYLVYHTADQISDFVLGLHMEYQNQNAYTNQILIGLLTYLTADIMRKFGHTMGSSYSPGIMVSQQSENFMVLNYIQQNIETLSLADVAEHFNFSISHCSKLIKSSTGMGFNDWKRVLRMRRAEHMLLNTNSSINDISYSLGYENPETFIRAFKKELHMTPSQYRKHRNREK